MSETITENIFRDFYSGCNFIEKSAIPETFSSRRRCEMVYGKK